MQKDQSHAELQVKKQARRRLVGAIALVLLMIIFLPMLLKDRAASGQKEKITITLPSDTPPPAVAPSDFDSNIVPSESSQTTTAEVGAVAETEINTNAETVEAPVSEPNKKLMPSEKPAVKTPAANKTAKADATALRYYVQIGVYSDIANVKQLQTKLTGLGYSSQTEKIKTDKGEKIRLRTHLFNDRNEAAIALENIKDAGLTGMVVSQK